MTGLAASYKYTDSGIRTEKTVNGVLTNIISRVQKLSMRKQKAIQHITATTRTAMLLG